VLVEGDGRGQKRPARAIAQHLGAVFAKHGHHSVRGAEIDADHRFVHSSSPRG
jgi:hypothetical protein